MRRYHKVFHEFFSIFFISTLDFSCKSSKKFDISNCSSANPLPVPGLDATNSTSTGIYSISEKQQSLQMSSLYLLNFFCFQMGSDQPRENCSPWGESVLPLLWQLLQQEIQPPQPFETRQRVS